MYFEPFKDGSLKSIPYTGRKRLAKGYARQQFEHILKNSVSLPEVLDQIHSIRPNKKSLQRVANRIRRSKGIISVGYSTKSKLSLQVFSRSAFTLKHLHENNELFDEDAIAFTRIDVEVDKRGFSTSSYRALFSLHSIQRLIERAKFNISKSLGDVVKNEGLCVLTKLKKDDVFGYGERMYLRSNNFSGVWAGEVTLSSENMGGKMEMMNFKTFNNRTFLSQDEMSPEIFIQWKKVKGVSINGIY